MSNTYLWEKAREELGDIINFSKDPDFFSFDKVNFFHLKDVTKVTTHDIKEEDKPEVRVFPTADYEIEVTLKNGEVFHNAYLSRIERNSIADKVSKYLNKEEEE